MLATDIPGVRIPDSTLAREATELVRDTESELLFKHSMRVYAWGALAGRRKNLAFDPELLYVGARRREQTRPRPTESELRRST